MQNLATLGQRKGRNSYYMLCDTIDEPKGTISNQYQEELCYMIQRIWSTYDGQTHGSKVENGSWLEGGAEELGNC